MADCPPISVIIPTWRRLEKLKICLRTLAQCGPPPAEVLIHIDAGDEDTEDWLKAQDLPCVKWTRSNSTQGPGGGRNWLISNATQPFLCGLDDDSWPMETDFFGRAELLMRQHAKAAVITLNEVRPGQVPATSDIICRPASSFQGCACLMRREALMRIQGFVPLRHAYGMEEADVSLQLLDAGWDILKCGGLHVFHDSTLTHQASRAINAAHISNTALLAFLRYPVSGWPLGAAQMLNRVRYAIQQRRFAGIINGLCAIPGRCWRYRHYRRVVRVATLRRSRQLARQKPQYHAGPTMPGRMAS